MSKRKIALTLCSIFSSLYGVSAGADSEDFFDLAPEHLAKLKITAASAFAESALDSSATVSVVGRADWERRGARNLPDAVTHLPGVMLLVPPDGGMVIQVRSYDSTSLRGRATMIDGVPINTFAFGSEVFSNAEMQLPVMDSLELVRGPSSILYGSDAFHSALLVSTYRGSVPEFAVSGEVGANQYRQVAMRGNQSFGDNQSLQGAISVAHQGDQGFEYSYRRADGTFGTAERAQTYDNATAMLRWEGNSSGVGYHLELFTDHADAEDYPGAGTIILDVRNRDIADRNSELWLLKGQLDGKLADAWDWQWDNYYWRNDYGQNYFLTSSTLEENQQIIEHRYGSKVSLKRPDLKFLKANTQLALSAGSERAAIDDHDVQSWLPLVPPDYTGLSQTIHNVSLEGKTQWQDGLWQLIYGGRLDDYSTFGAQFSPRFGGIWMPSRDYSVKALYGEAFRAPNANELRGTNFAAGDPDLKPETLDSYELAFTMVRNNWQAELVGFKTRWHDRILLVRQPTARYVNVGESDSRGVEASGSYVAERWRVELSASRITNRNRITHVESTVFPKWIFNAGLGYRWPAQRLEIFWSNRLHENVKSGDQALAQQQLADAGTFIRSDLSLRQQWGSNWQGQLSLRNMFDRDNVWPSIVNSRGGIEDIPRQLSLEVEYRGLP